MKILFTRFPLESTLGGAEIQTLALMEGLIERGHAVAFAGSCPTLLEECTKRGIINAEMIIGKPPVTKISALTFAWRKKRMGEQLTAVVKEFGRLDAIVMLSMSEKLLLTDVAADLGIRVFWIEHDTVGRWLTKNPWLNMLLEQSQHATTVTVSALSKGIYTDLGWDETRVVAIPNGIEESRIGKPLKRERKTAAAPLKLGCIARLSPEKGVDVLIEAMKAAPKHVTLEIVGEGPEARCLIGSANDRVTFKGRVDEIHTAYARFDALVLPSREHDPFGLVAAETMMLGLPVIVTDACGIAGYLTHNENAIIAKADSVSALTQAIQSLTDPATFHRLAKNGAKTALEKFSAKSMVDAYESLFTGSAPSTRDS
jgi:glycosyltransferase involved in cell wall biosynthesis